MAMYDPAYDFYSPEQERRRSLFRWLLIKVLESPAWVEMAPPPESLAGQREAWAEVLYQHLLYSFRGARCCDVQADRYCRVGLVLCRCMNRLRISSAYSRTRSLGFLTRDPSPRRKSPIMVKGP